MTTKTSFQTDTRSKEKDLDPVLVPLKLRGLAEDIENGRIEVIFAAENMTRGTRMIWINYQESKK